MTILVIAEHNYAVLAAATLNTVAAAKAIGGDIHVLVAGAGCAAIGEAAAKIDGVSKVLVADDAAYAGVRAELEAELARLQTQYGDSPELAQEMVERYPHGSRPEWGRYSVLEPHGDLDGWRAAQERNAPVE